MTFLRFFVASAALPGASGLRLNRVPFEALVANSGTETLGHDVCPGGTADGGAPGLRVAQMGDQAQKQCEMHAWNSGYTDSFYMEQMKVKGAEDEQQENSVSDHQKFVFNGNHSDESEYRRIPFAAVTSFVERSKEIEAEFRQKNYKLRQDEKLTKLEAKLVEENAKLKAELLAALTKDEDELLAENHKVWARVVENRKELAAEKKRVCGLLSGKWQELEQLAVGREVRETKYEKYEQELDLEFALVAAKYDKRDRELRAKQDKWEAEVFARQDKLEDKLRAKQDELKAEVFAEQDKLKAKLEIMLRGARGAGRAGDRA